MNLNFISSATLFEATKATIEKIDVKNLDEKNLVIVPDSFSMQAESLIFDVLNVKSTFNIAVVGISRLASKILREHNISVDRISGLSEILYTYKAVKENEKNFLYFKNYGIDFCVKVLQILKQFKSCFVKVEDITDVEDKVLSMKMHDLKLIYSSYLKFLEDKFDLSKLLVFFLEKSEFLDLKNYNLFFVNFDSFSTEIFDFICNLAEKVKSVYISIAKPLSLGNAYIYEEDTAKKMFNLAVKNKLNIKVEEKKPNLKKAQEAVIKNVFSVTKEKCEEDFFANIVTSNKESEIEFVAKLIRYKIFEGERYKNFSLAIPSEDYFKDIENIFAKYQIPVYMDYTLSLRDISVTNFFLKIYKIALGGINKNELEYLLSSPFLNISEREEKLKKVDYYDIENYQDYLKLDNSLEEIARLINDISKVDTTIDFCLLGQKILNLMQLNLENFLKNITNLQKKSENEQAVSLITKILEEINMFDLQEHMNLKDFIFLLETVFKSVKVETVPSYIDAVYVGDATKSYFEDVPYLFVLGTTSGNLPKTEKDCGIITDEDLGKLKFVVEPEIRVINRRNRLKLFEVLQHATKKLFVLTPIGTEQKKSSFVEDLIETFGKKSVVNASSFEKFDRADLKEEEMNKLLLFNLGAKDVAEKNFKKIEKNLNKNYKNSVNSVVGQEIFQFNYENLNNKPILKKISASKLERYFCCPFKFFVSHLIDVKEKEYAKEDKRKIGILKHELAKLFIEKFGNIKTIDDSQIEGFLKDNFLNSAKKVFEEVTLKNRVFMHILRNETFNMLSNFVYEQKMSEFTPKYLEKFVSGKIGSLDFSGIIDRVDVFDNYFRIIDYKTGQTGSILKELYYGKKLQLFLYGNIMKNIEKKECVGVYYFDCKNKFKKKNVSTKLLDGLTLKDNDVVFATDYRLADEGVKSDLIGASKKKKAGEDGFLFKYGNFANSFDKYFDYAVKVSEGAIKEIEEGYIMPKPLENECERCQFKAICKNFKSETRSMRKVDED